MTPDTPSFGREQVCGRFRVSVSTERILGDRDVRVVIQIPGQEAHSVVLADPVFSLVALLLDGSGVVLQSESSSGKTFNTLLDPGTGEKYEGIAAPTRQEAILLTELFEETLSALSATSATDDRHTPQFRFRDPAVAATRAQKSDRAKPVPKHRAFAESRVAQKPQCLSQVKGDLSSVHLARNGRFALLAADEGLVIVDVPSLIPVGSLLTERPLRGAALSHSGRLVALAQESERPGRYDISIYDAQVLDLARGAGKDAPVALAQGPKPNTAFRAASSGVPTLLFSPNDAGLALVTGVSASLFDLSGTLTSREPHKCDRFADPEDKKPLVHLYGTMAFHPGGDLVAFFSSRGSVEIRKVLEPEPLRSISTAEESVSILVFCPKGQFLAAVLSSTAPLERAQRNEIRLWETSTGNEVSRWSMPSSAASLAFSPDSAVLAVGSYRSPIRLYEVGTGLALQEQCEDSSNYTLGLSFLPEGKAIVAGSAQARQVRCWEHAPERKIAQSRLEKTAEKKPKMTKHTKAKGTGTQAKNLEQFLSTLRPEARAVLAALESECGVDFVWVPPGRYPLGTPAGELRQLFGNGYFAYTTPVGEWLEATGFLLSAEPLTVQAYQRILHSDSPALAQTGGVLAPTEAEAHRFNHEQYWHEGKVYKVQRVEKDLQDPEPALVLAFDSARLLADSLCACLPTWQRWEAAARGPEGFPFPWGREGWDRGKLRISKLPYSSYWEDPESTMGMGRDSGVTRGEFVRLDDLGDYATMESPLGLRRLIRWGAEWNTAQDDLGTGSAECRSRVIRSLTDCGEQIGAAEISDLPAQTRAIVSSNHRAFSGMHCASFGSPTRFPVAAFRLLFAPDTRPLAKPVVSADPDPRLAELLGCSKNELLNHLGAPQSTDHYSSSTSGTVYSSETWNWQDLGISAKSFLRQSGSATPTTVESITLWSNTLRDLEVGEKFCAYGRPVGTRGVRLGMSEAEVRKREGSEKVIVPGAQVSTEYREGRLWQVSLRKKP